MQLLGGHAARVHQQIVGVHAPGLCFQQHLCVVIVILDLEHINDVPIGGEEIEVVKGALAHFGEHLVDAVHGDLFRFRIAALLQNLDGFCGSGGFQHTLHTLPGQETALQRPDAGGEKQIICVFDLGQWFVLLFPFSPLCCGEPD